MRRRWGGLLQAIEMKVEMINRMAHLTPVRAKEVTESIGSPTLRREIERQLARVLLERDDVLEVVEGKLRGDGGVGLLTRDCSTQPGAGTRPRQRNCSFVKNSCKTHILK